MTEAIMLDLPTAIKLYRREGPQVFLDTTSPCMLMQKYIDVARVLDIDREKKASQ